MFSKLAFLHLRWFGLFAFVASFAIFYGHVQEGNMQVFTTSKFWTDLAPIIATCAILSVLVPWGAFMVDPRRATGPVTLESFLKYWKVI